MIKGTSYGSKTYKWLRTPDIIWDELKTKYKFTIDACADDKNHLVDRYWTKKDNALKQNWDNEIIYCNPMYDSQIGKFVKKAIESKNSIIVFLIPAGTSSKYFHTYLWDEENQKTRENVNIRFLPQIKNGYQFKDENNNVGKTGYIHRLMIVEIKTR